MLASSSNLKERKELELRTETIDRQRIRARQHIHQSTVDLMSEQGRYVKQAKTVDYYDPTIKGQNLTTYVDRKRIDMRENIRCRRQTSKFQFDEILATGSDCSLSSLRSPAAVGKSSDLDLMIAKSDLQSTKRNLVMVKKSSTEEHDMRKFADDPRRYELSKISRRIRRPRRAPLPSSGVPPYATS